MRIPRHVLALLFVAAVGVIVAAMVLPAAGYSAAAGTVPLVVGVPTLVFIVLQLARDGLRVVRGDVTVGETSEVEQDRYVRVAASVRQRPVAQVPAGGEVDRSTSMPAAFAWVVALALLIWLVGLLVAIPVFMAAFMKIFGRERWITIAAFAAGTTVAVYAFFSVVLDIRLYQGLFGDILPWP